MVQLSKDLWRPLKQEMSVFHLCVFNKIYTVRGIFKVCFLYYLYYPCYKNIVMISWLGFKSQIFYLVSRYKGS